MYNIYAIEILIHVDIPRFSVNSLHQNQIAVTQRPTPVSEPKSATSVIVLRQFAFLKMLTGSVALNVDTTSTSSLSCKPCTATLYVTHTRPPSTTGNSLYR